MEALENKIVRILLIEDNSGDARLIQEQLKEVSEIAYELDCVTQLQEGLDHLAKHPTDIILSDLSLPDSPGLETFKRLQTQASHVPVIVLTGFDNKSVALEAVRDGAQDYLIKGQVEGKTLSRLILYAIERNRTQATLRSQSLTDPLTGLNNRRGFITLAEQALRSARRTQVPLYLFFADLDGLKPINDTYGHKEGDLAIVHTAEVLRKTFREADILARIGGDEFVILASQDKQTEPGQIMFRLQENLKQYNLKSTRYKLSLSVGAAQFDPVKTASVEELLEKADELLYREKQEKKAHKLTQIWKNKKIRYLGGMALVVAAAFLAVRERRSIPPSLPVPPPAAPVAPVVPPPPVIPMVKPASPVPAVRKSIRLAAPKPVKPPELAQEHPKEVPTEVWLRDVSIVRFSYSQQIVPPGAALEFDIIGSGFTPELQKSLSISLGASSLQVKDLRLVTANQIHGEVSVALDAITQYVFPRVFLKDRMFSQVSQPFAVIRNGEVLDILFSSLDEDGRGGRFRVFTNLDPDTAKSFRLKASAAGLDISGLQPHLPYAIDGALRLGEGIDHGDYDLIAFLGSREVFRKKRMLHIVKPNFGQTGEIESLTAAERYHRPGDNVEMFLQGAGFSPEDIETLNARVDEINMGKASYTFISPTRIGIYVTIPKETPEGAYGMIVEEDRQLVFRQKAVFAVVPANWVAGVQMTPTAPGNRSTLKLLGRDFSADFANQLHLAVDEPGIQIATPKRIDANTLSAAVAIDSSVEPGNYLVEITWKGTTLKLPLGNLIQISSP